MAPEENNLINRSYCHKRSADYKNLIVRLVTMVPSHNNCNVSSFLSPSPTPTYQAAEKNGFTAKIELLSHSNWKYGTCTGAAGIIRAMLVFVLNPPPTPPLQVQGSILSFCLTAIGTMGPARGRQVVLKSNSQSGSEAVALNSGVRCEMGSVTLKNSLSMMILNLQGVPKMY